MLAKIAEAIEDIKAGKFIIIVDDENRENEETLLLQLIESVPALLISWLHTRED